MADSFAARFAAVRTRYGSLVCGLDPSGVLLERWGLGDSADGLDRFADIRRGLPRRGRCIRSRRGDRPSLSRARRHGRLRVPRPPGGRLPAGRDQVVESGGPGGTGRPRRGRPDRRGHAAQRDREAQRRAGAGRDRSGGRPGRPRPPAAVAGPGRCERLVPGPGLGAQGATCADVARTFAACPGRVMPSASRSLLSAGPDPVALRDAMAALSAELQAVLP
jgi:hypothetical protein